MKKMTHGWIALKAIDRLNGLRQDKANWPYGRSLRLWLRRHSDDVTQGAWYPDDVIKDMATSHVLKLTPSSSSKAKSFRKLPGTHRTYGLRSRCPLSEKGFVADKDDNLPDRCESLAHALVDNLKMQRKEEKGSPVTPTANHVALLFYMLSHYIADAHMPLHCDSRPLGSVHRRIEQAWENEILGYYCFDKDTGRFAVDRQGSLLRKEGKEEAYRSSYLTAVDQDLNTRDFSVGFGPKNGNVWDFMNAVCQYSHKLSYAFLPKQRGDAGITAGNWRSLGNVTFEEMSVAVLSDAVDSIARVWFRVWRRYSRWAAGQ
jgi:hypothetical protein